MTVQLTIIGLGRIGSSIGLALASHKEQVIRLGHDKNPAAARQAEKMGAIDRFNSNLPDSVRKADLVLLCLPADQLLETMQLISLDLRQGAVVMDTSPIKETVANWARETLPAGQHYVGLLPVINPDYLLESITGQEASHPDLFQNGLVAITSPPGTDSAAIKLASDLVQMLGSMPLFVDTAEIDGLMASTLSLPQLLATTLLNATVGQPGWQEGRKVAGSAYANACQPLFQSGDFETIKATILHNNENVLRVLDNAIVELYRLRGIIAEKDENALKENLVQAYQSGQRWRRERQAGDWDNQQTAPIEKRSLLSHLIGTNPRPRAKPKSTH